MLDLTRLRVLLAVARTGSVTAAARALHYSQPSVSHHLARLESESGAKLVQRVGRGIRLTDDGQLLAERAAEIVGRVDAAEAELAARVGLQAGRVRLAAFPSALGTLVPTAAADLRHHHPALELQLDDAEPPDALRLLRSGAVDVALIFRYDDTQPEPDGIRLTHLVDEPSYLVTAEPAAPELRPHADAKWIVGCERCRMHVLDLCDRAGFVPSITSSTDDYVAIQAMVAAGLGVAVLPALALVGHRHPRIHAVELPGSVRRVYAATYGEPPDPPATAALLAAAATAASTVPPVSAKSSFR